eukprot:3139864-Prymnesium_polylepis.1
MTCAAHTPRSAFAARCWGSARRIRAAHPSAGLSGWIATNARLLCARTCGHRTYSPACNAQQGITAVQQGAAS